MGFKLPELLADVDLGPLGYPGIVVTCWVNITAPAEEWKPPDKPKEWDRPFFVTYSRISRHIKVPGSYREDGADYEADLSTPQALYEFLEQSGWDQGLFQGALWSYLVAHRQELYESARKNLSSGSGGGA